MPRLAREVDAGQRVHLLAGQVEAEEAPAEAGATYVRSAAQPALAAPGR